MKKNNPFLILLAALLVLTLSACATRGQEAPALYDLGPMAAEQRNPLQLQDNPPFLLTTVQPSSWLDNTMIYYRLAYRDNQQTRVYANSRWNMPPAKLFEQRLKSRIAAAGGVALPAKDGVGGILLRLELEDFSQRFDDAEHSVAQVELRVSALKGRTLLGQKTFRQTSPSRSADAVGGAKALAVASDALITETMIWLVQLQQRTND